MSKVLALDKSNRDRRPTKKKRRTCQLIETPPKPEWFVITRERGRDGLVLRFPRPGYSAQIRPFGTVRWPCGTRCHGQFMWMAESMHNEAET